MENISQMNIVLNQLLNQIKIDEQRIVCSNCNDLGHDSTSKSCKVNIENDYKLKSKIKKYVLSRGGTPGKNIYDYCCEASVLLNITPELCKTLYDEIPLFELLIDDEYEDDE
jgi:hypothetical protein